MSRKEALTELIATVDAAEVVQAVDACAIWPEIGIWGEVCRASQGSLDAALALHQALLPGEGWDVQWVAKYPNLAFKPAAFVASVGWGTVSTAYADTPARAFLLAILKALYAKEPKI